MHSINTTANPFCILLIFLLLISTTFAIVSGKGLTHVRSLKENINEHAATLSLKLLNQKFVLNNHSCSLSFINLLHRCFKIVNISLYFVPADSLQTNFIDKLVF